MEPSTNNSMSLEDICKLRFINLTNKQLVDRINQAADFKWDDEGVELTRRINASNGTFNVQMQQNTLIILIDN